MISQLQSMNPVSLFQGEVSDLVAKIYLQVDPQLPAEITLSAQIKGPRCKLSETLPFSIQFQKCASDDQRLYQATIPDPCFWTPALPMLYDVAVELQRDESTVAEITLPIGMKSFVATGASLYQQKRRTVLRGGFCRVLDRSHWQAWRESSTTLCLKNPTDVICHQASEQGLGVDRVVGKLTRNRDAAGSESINQISGCINDRVARGIQFDRENHCYAKESNFMGTIILQRRFVCWQY